MPAGSGDERRLEKGVLQRMEAGMIGRSQDWYASCAPDYLDGEEDEQRADEERRRQAEEDRDDLRLEKRRGN
jgi:hypothetical protein